MTDAEFIDLPDEVVTNEYDDIVARQIEAGEKKGYTLTSPTADHPKLRRRYADAAKRAGKTARAVTSTTKGDETTTILKLVPKIVHKPKDADEGEAETDDE